MYVGSELIDHATGDDLNASLLLLLSTQIGLDATPISYREPLPHLVCSVGKEDITLD